MKQKTAIRQLIEKLESIPLESDYYKLGIVAAIRIARELEAINEQQIKDAYVYGYGMGANRKSTSDDKYMDETFEKP